VFLAWIQQQNKQTFLLGNKAWKSLFDILVPDSNIECIWLDKKEWFSSFEYRKTILEQIISISPEEVIHASYTRVLVLEGIVKKCLSASKHLAWETKPGPFSNELNKGFDFLKKRIIGLHETENNLAFFEDINQRKIQVNFHLNFPSNKRKIEQEYFIICPGGNQKSKQWPAQQYAEIANLVLDKNPALTCVLIGGPGDEKISNEIYDTTKKCQSLHTINKD
jgi:ADP-heptose:LPS heptosyltransferase